MMTLEQARESLARCAGRRVLVVGDLMLDRYVSGKVTRISPEAPVPVVRVTREHALPGGAANVALNVQSLGGRATVVGVVGRDAAGEQLMQILAGQGIDTAGVVVSARAQTSVKTRVLAEHQQIVRVDRESAAEWLDDSMEELADRAERLVDGVDGVVIEDYGKGVIRQGVVDRVSRRAGQRGVVVGLDPKDNEELTVPHLTLATPNYKEACLAAGLRETELPDDPMRSETLRRAGQILVPKWNTELLVITLGAHGMYLVPRGGAPYVIPTKAREVFDVSGAGDTVIATAVLVAAAGVAKDAAAHLANFAAGVVVGKLGTATCTVGEILKAVESAQ